MKKEWFKKWDIVLLSIIALFLLGILIWMNLFRIQNVISTDSTTAYAAIIEMVKQKSIFLSNYNYGSSFLIDSPAPLAALIYWVTGMKSVQLAQGLSNIIIIGFILGLFYGIMKRLNYSFRAWIILVVLFLTPYAAGMLYYIELFLFSYSQYSVRVLICLLAMYTFLLINGKSKKIWKWSFMAILFISLLLGSISSGLFYILTMFIPFFVITVFKWAMSEKNKDSVIKKNEIIFAIAFFLICAMGCVLQKKMIQSGFVYSELVSQSALNVRGFGIMTVGLKNAIQCFFYAFSGVIADYAVLVSKSTIRVFLSISFIGWSIFIFGYTQFLNKSKKNNEMVIRSRFDNFIIVSFLFQCFMMIMLYQVAPRYWYTVCIFFFILIAGRLEDLYNSAKNNLYKVCILALCVLSFGFLLLQVPQTIQRNNHINVCREIVDVAKENNTKLVVDYAHEDASSICYGRMVYALSEGKMKGISYKKDLDHIVDIGTMMWKVEDFKDQSMILLSPRSDLKGKAKFLQQVDDQYLYKIQVSDFQKMMEDDFFD